jgi:hypothetical protein
VVDAPGRFPKMDPAADGSYLSPQAIIPAQVGAIPLPVAAYGISHHVLE